MVRFPIRILILGWFLAICGCSGVKLSPVTGKVLYKNEGVTAGSIFFLPDESKGNKGSGGSSVLQLDGSFTIANPEEGKTSRGVRPGWYKVTIRCAHREPEFSSLTDVKTTPFSFNVPDEGIKDLIIKVDEQGSN